MKHWTIKDLKSYALLNRVPIIQDDALAYIQNYIKNNEVKEVLEIGTAYGYSAVSFSSETTHVDTIERDEVCINEATKWIQLLDANVTLHQADALTYNGLNKQYDLIFIDGAKSQYQVFFDKYSAYLAPGGVVICDNINFHHLDINTVKNRNTKGLLKKLDNFKSYIKAHHAFDTIFLDIGDGLTVSKKKDD